MAEVLLNQEQIKEIIPHRAPFLLIDEVLEMEVGKRVVARKYIKADDFWFKGHFPEKPVTPGVLMIEMLAQAGAVAILSEPENQGKVAYFGGIDKNKAAAKKHAKQQKKYDNLTAKGKQPTWKVTPSTAVDLELEQDNVRELLNRLTEHYLSLIHI